MSAQRKFQDFTSIETKLLSHYDVVPAIQGPLNGVSWNTFILFIFVVIEATVLITKKNFY